MHSPLRNALFSAVAVVLALTGIEATVRGYHAVRNSGAASIDLHAYWIDDAEAGYSLAPGYTAGSIRINALGFRGPEISRDEPRGTFRIVALGDSTTFGPREAECAYPYQLAPMLQSREVEVINAGVEGYRSDRALIHLQRDVLALHSDLVLVFIGWDDLYQVDAFADSASDPSPSVNPVQRVLSWSAAAQTVRRVYYEHLPAPAAAVGWGITSRPSFVAAYRPAQYAANLDRILRAARSAGADVLVLTWPTLLAADMLPADLELVQYPYYTHSIAELNGLYADYQQTLRDVAAQDQVAVVDVAVAFDGVRKRDYFTDAIHLNCAGHTVIAEQLAPAISALLDAAP